MNDAPACATCVPKRLGQVALVLVLLTLVGAWMVQSKPGWWEPPAGAPRGGTRVAEERATEASNANEHGGLLNHNSLTLADERARALEQGLVSEFTRVRPAGEQWAIRVRSADANAWLALRLPQWLAHDRELPWPDGVDMVQLHLATGDRITLGADRGGWVWSATMLVVLEDGRLTLQPVGGALGRLWIPWMSSADGSSDGALSIAAFVPELAHPVDAIVPLPDGRRVKLLDFEFADDEALFRFETLPR